MRRLGRGPLPASTAQDETQRTLALTRKLLRPSLEKSPGARHQVGARRKPPEASGAEANYLAQARDSGATLIIRLLNGQDLKGSLEFYDRRVLKLVEPSGQRLMLRREQIRYYHAERPGD